MIYRSPLPDVTVPDVTLVDHVLGRARDLGDKVALVDGTTGERLTYAALAEGASRAAGGLAGLGVGAGDVVGVVSHNQPRYALAVYGVLWAGAVVTPANPALTVDELAKQFATARAKVVISSAEAAEKVAEVAARLGIRHHLVLGEEPVAGARRFADLLAAAPVQPARVDPRAALAALPFSSGTTGASKGVMLTHRNLVANLVQFGVGWRLDEADVAVAALPFFHIYGFEVIMNAALAAGATVVTLGRYSLPDYLRVVQEHRVTWAFLAPPMVLQIAKAPDAADYDLSSLRYGVSGAAPLDPAVTERAEARLGCLVRQGYGMTEASPGTHHVTEAWFDRLPAGCVGFLMASTEARLVDPGTGTDAAPGEPGELWVRGPQVMAGYLDAEEATARTLVDGWLRTGDIARVDDDGVFWVVDRLKELIKYKGYQVPPAELEALLLTHPDILDAAVVGAPDPEAGEIPTAFVVAARPIDADAVLAWVGERVAPYKKIRRLTVVDAIPKSPSGKILRRLLRSPAGHAPGGPTP